MEGRVGVIGCLIADSSHLSIIDRANCRESLLAKDRYLNHRAMPPTYRTILTNRLVSDGATDSMTDHAERYFVVWSQSHVFAKAFSFAERSERIQLLVILRRVANNGIVSV